MSNEIKNCADRYLSQRRDLIIFVLLIVVKNIDINIDIENNLDYNQLSLCD